MPKEHKILDEEAIKNIKTHMCIKHGPSNAYMNVTIFGEIERHYCMYCLIEKFDELGIQHMEKIR